MLSHALHASFAENAEQRASDRRVLKLEARAAMPSGAGGVEVHNLSRTGMLIEGDTGIAVGASIEVELPGGTTHRAEIVWADEFLAGCRFTAPLTRGQLSAALLRSEAREPLVRAANTPHEEGLARLHSQWKSESDTTGELCGKLPLQTRFRIIAALGLAAWAVPAAAAWMLL